MSISETRARAFDIIRAKSFVRRKITLSSGKESDHYFDMKPAMLDPEGAGLLCELILHKLTGIEVDFVGGLEMGAVPLLGPLAMVSRQQGRPIPGLFVRKLPKEHGTRRQIEGVDDVRGKRIAVVEDVTTTGASAMKSIGVLREAGAIVPIVITIVDREEGAAALYRDAGIPFQALFTASEFLKGE